ncbi:phenoloxidase-activating factor 2-like [Drosophila teissieri]|uniref:phenoloxidase-activating factor 2-like n=1 Tax=Drosophila teissieri TaxID=7243 RepID=UPI001CB9E061|nr:phenoloxidase-activating factor 2-like [Drosophila teissieri]
MGPFYPYYYRSIVSPWSKEYSQDGEFPWTIALFSRGSFFGGGSLIAPRVVLTAAHLLLSKTADEIVVRAGEWDMASVDELRRHEEVDRHENFEYMTGANDIAILYLDSPFALKDHIQPICLPIQLASSLMCAGGDKNEDACIGDGGFSLFCSPDPIIVRFQQVGIVAWGV